MSFENTGSLTTDKRDVSDSEIWETQTDWEAYQSISNIDITNGVLSLAEQTTGTLPAVSGTWDKALTNPEISNSSFGSSIAWHDLLYEDSTYKLYFSAGSKGSYSIGLTTSSDSDTWTENANNPLISPGSGWESDSVRNPSVINNSGTYEMIYAGYNGSDRQFGIATSTDGVSWTKDANNPVLSPGSGWESGNILDPYMILVNGTYHLYYTGNDGSGTTQIGHATSTDLVNWTRDSNNPILSPSTSGWDDGKLRVSSVSYIENEFHLWYGGISGTSTQNRKMGLAKSSDGTSFTRDTRNPVLARGSGWEETDTFRHSVVYNGTEYVVMYVGQNSDYSIGKATLGQMPSDLVESWNNGVVGPKFTGDTGAYETTAAQVTEGGQSLTAATNSDMTIHASGSELNYAPSRGDVIDSMIRLDTAPVNLRLLFLGADRSNTYAIAYNTGADILRILRIDSGSVTELASNSVTQRTDEWLRIETDLDTAGDGTIEAEAFDSTGTSLGTRVTANDTTYNDNGLGIYMNGSNGNRAWVDEVRKTN